MQSFGTSVLQGREHVRLLIDLGDLADECCNDTLDELAKAQRYGEVSHLWDRSPNRFIADHIEAVSIRLDNIIAAMRDMLVDFFRGGSNALLKADLPWLRWSEAHFRIVQSRLNSMNPALMTLADYELLTDFIIQRYLPDGVIAAESEYLAVRAALLGKIQANLEMDRRVTDPMLDRIVALLPTGFAAVPPHVFTPTEAAMLDYGRAHAAEAIRGVAEATRHRMATIVLQHVQAGIVGQREGGWRYLSNRLFDVFSATNRDMRRISITEIGEIQNQAYIASKEPGQQVRRIEAYRGACDFCTSINGKVFNVVSPTDPKRNQDTDIWLGKNNIGRSASPMKRVGNVLVERTRDEMWTVTGGLIHPNCFVSPKVPIYTSEGWKPISDVSVGDQVLTHLGRFRAVTWVLEPTSYAGPVFGGIASSGGRNRERLPAMTADHPVRSGDRWVSACNLTVGDKLTALGKRCPTCDGIFVNLKFPHINYCSIKCSPRPGINQFSTTDPEALAAAKAVTGEANVRRMARLTVEQRAALTASGRAVAVATDYHHLRNRTPETRSKLGRSAARYNYKPAPVEIAISRVLTDLGCVAAHQHRVPKTQPDSKGRQRYWWLDLALPDQKIGVEIDGEPWHGRLANGRDLLRDTDLEVQGWTIIRIQSVIANADPEAAAREIARVAMNHDGMYVFGSVQIDRIIHRNVRAASLYNFAVEEDESYIVGGGFVVHNCRGSWAPVTQRPPEVSEAFFSMLSGVLAKV